MKKLKVWLFAFRIKARNRKVNGLGKQHANVQGPEAFSA